MDSPDVFGGLKGLPATNARRRSPLKAGFVYEASLPTCVPRCSPPELMATGQKIPKGVWAINRWATSPRQLARCGLRAPPSPGPLREAMYDGEREARPAEQ